MGNKSIINRQLLSVLRAGITRSKHGVLTTIAHCSLPIAHFRGGFTIVELMLYMALMTTGLLVLTDLFLTVLEQQAESSVVASVDQDGRFLLARLNYDVGRSSAITSPANLGESTTAARLVIEGASHTYTASPGGQLVVTTDLGTDNLNSFGTQISGLSFTRLGNPAGKNSLQVKFKLTGRTIKKSGLEERSFQTTIGTR
ncbi:MAG: hypothetical protein UY21_C0003G0008 [Microgenomates group bacterium GW2011_GWA1_48_10]|nr:MAG: hypothetical protein UY21_C0003G0008 [Microgenomates group bacterium GW2011_GWA1_48_10]